MPKRVEKTLGQCKELLYNFFQTNKRMPTYQEACSIFDVKSKDTAYRIIQKVAVTGFVSIDDYGKIIPSDAFFQKQISPAQQQNFIISNKLDLTEKSDRKVYKNMGIGANGSVLGGLKMLGLVEAGFPSPAEEDLNAETISLDDWIIDKREASFMLKVKGDSMYDAGIRDGDMVIVERGLTPKVGEIVIARTEDGWTMKYLKKKPGKNGAFYLQPANTDYPDIEPHEVLEIAAVVKGVVRKY